MLAVYSVIREKSNGPAPTIVATCDCLCAAQMANRSFLKPGKPDGSSLALDLPNVIVSLHLIC